MFNPNPPHAVRSPIMYQSWSNISFLHWQYDGDVLQSRIPDGLFIDKFQGAAWISLTPFLLEHLRMPLMPPLPWLSRFPEMNLRTYVNGPAGPGIWFFSLDADRLPAVVGARFSFGLPYHWADMQVVADGNRMHYYASRGGRARTNIEVETGPPFGNPDELATFLVARFRLYSMHRGRLISVPVEHKRWPLHHARILNMEQTVTDAARLHVHDQRLQVHFSPGVHVRVGPALKHR